MRATPFRRSPLVRIGVACALVTLAVSGWQSLRGPAAFDANWQRVVFEVPELDCTFWCSVKLSTILEVIPGVRVESFDTRTRWAAVRYDPDRADVDGIAAALRAHGIVNHRVEVRGP